MSDHLDDLVFTAAHETACIGLNLIEISELVP